MPQETWRDTYKALARAIWLGAGVFVLLWFFDAAMGAVLFAGLLLVLSVALNAPVRWLERRRLPRWLALLAVLLGIAGAVTLLGWFVAPRVAEQAVALAEEFPTYVQRIEERAAEMLAKNPEIRDRILGDKATVLDSVTPVLQAFVTRIGRYSLSLAGVLVAGLLLATAAVYAVAAPGPLLKGTIGAFPPHLRGRATRAISRGSQSVVGWVWSNVIIGTIEAVAAGVFLTWLGVPGALVWAGLTFFAELVPKIGAYLMAVPPILVALAVDPMDAVWVAAFYVAIQWLAGDLLGPVIQAKKMRLHPVSVILATVAMGSAFGLLGALLATPLAGFVKAFYDQFHGVGSGPDGLADERLETILNREDKEA